MVCRHRGQLHAVDRTLRRERLRDRRDCRYPAFKPPPGVRVIPLLGFPLVVIGAAWAGKLSPITQQFLAEVEIEANAVKRSTKSR